MSKEYTPAGGVLISLDQAIDIWKRECLPSRAITYLVRRIGLDLDPPEDHIKYERKTRYQSITATSRMAGHEFLAIMYGWECIKSKPADNPKIESLPQRHSIRIGVLPLIDLLDLSAKEAACSIYVECFGDRMIVGKPKYPQRFTGYQDFKIYLDAYDLTRALHAELTSIAGKN